jgi:hypothetical protein
MSAVPGILNEAERAAREAETRADLLNFLFDPVDGLVAGAYPTREAFVRTDEYQKLRQLVADAMRHHGLVEGATPKKSGRFVVRLPQSLHAALERGAAAEGVGLNQLALPLCRLAREPEPGAIGAPHAP